MFRRKQSNAFYAYPEHRTAFRRLLWHLGFDPLTVWERLAQVDCERAYWKGLVDAQ